MTAKREKRCLLCGREGHFRSDCPLASQESKGGKRSAALPQAQAATAAAPKGHNVPKAKSVPQAKGITEETLGDSSASAAASAASSGAQEALFAEAAKLLKNVSQKPLRLDPEV